MVHKYQFFVMQCVYGITRVYEKIIQSQPVYVKTCQGVNQTSESD